MGNPWVPLTTTKAERANKKRKWLFSKVKPKGYDNGKRLTQSDIDWMQRNPELPITERYRGVTK